MSDEQIIKQINESKAEQVLRENLQASKSFVPENSFQEKALENYNNMDESQKSQFIQKGWKNG